MPVRSRRLSFGTLFGAVAGPRPPRPVVAPPVRRSGALQCPPARRDGALDRRGFASCDSDCADLPGGLLADEVRRMPRTRTWASLFGAYAQSFSWWRVGTVRAPTVSERVWTTQVRDLGGCDEISRFSHRGFTVGFGRRGRLGVGATTEASIRRDHRVVVDRPHSS